VRWPWQRQRHDDDDAQQALQLAQQCLRDEQRRLVEVRKVTAALREHRRQNNFAEAMRVAFGGKP
jgi:hypothetical protein